MLPLLTLLDTIFSGHFSAEISAVLSAEKNSMGTFYISANKIFVSKPDF